MKSVEFVLHKDKFIKYLNEFIQELSAYGTTLENCFGMEEAAEPAQGAIWKRVRVASVWNGKKVYLEEFYQILKNAIDETQLLIQEKDRELFEDILSQTISQQLTDRIAELLRPMNSQIVTIIRYTWNRHERILDEQ